MLRPKSVPAHTQGAVTSDQPELQCLLQGLAEQLMLQVWLGSHHLQAAAGTSQDRLPEHIHARLEALCPVHVC